MSPPWPPTPTTYLLCLGSRSCTALAEVGSQGPCPSVAGPSHGVQCHPGSSARWRESGCPSFSELHSLVWMDGPHSFIRPSVRGRCVNTGLWASVPCLLSVPLAAHQMWARWVVGRFCGHVSRTLHTVFHGDPSHSARGSSFPTFPPTPVVFCCFCFLFNQPSWGVSPSGEI